MNDVGNNTKETVIEVKGLSYKIDDKSILKEVSFSVKKDVLMTRLATCA